jgi:Icc-related predicted phosphoesterase
MITFVGDIHGDYDLLYNVDYSDEKSQVIQVGDFGVTLDISVKWNRVDKLEKPIYFIDGNHEYFPLLLNYTEPAEIADGLIYLPRGTIKEIDGMKVGFCGGGTSIDKIMRTPGYNWFPEEKITRTDVQSFKNVGKLDLLVTHVPPASYMKENPNAGDIGIVMSFGFPSDFIDSCSYMVGDIWDMVGNPPLICGHLHKATSDGVVRILRDREVLDYVPGMELQISK